MSVLVPSSQGLKKKNMRLSRSSFNTPEQANFYHLVMDIAWFGVAVAATSRFLSIYAIRLGANSDQLSMMTALPAVFMFIGSVLAGRWRARYEHTVSASLWPGFWFRFVFLLPAFTPLMPIEFQPVWLILSVTIPAIPQGISSVIFLKLMRESVDQTRITELVSQRFTAMNIVLVISVLAYGVWLEKMPFPFSYQSMFFIAFLATLVSLWHVKRVQPQAVPLPERNLPTTTFQPMSAWKNPEFRRVALIVGAAWIAFHSVFSLVPLRIVKELGGSEGFMALFGMVELGSAATMAFLASRVIAKVGNRHLIAMAMTGTGIASLINALAPVPEVTLLAALINGAAWTAADIGLFGYLAENTPNENAYTTAYYQVVSVGIACGPWIGKILASDLGWSVASVLLVGAILRITAGAVAEFSSRTHGHAVPLQSVGTD
jgi:MFS family permease